MKLDSFIAGYLIKKMQNNEFYAFYEYEMVETEIG